MRDEDLHWGDVITNSQKARLVNATLRAIKEAIAPLKSYGALPAELFKLDFSVGMRRKVQTFWLTKDGVLKITVERRGLGRESETERSLVSDAYLVSLISDQWTSSPDIKALVNRAKTNYHTAEEVREIGELPQIKDLVDNQFFHRATQKGSVLSLDFNSEGLTVRWVNGLRFGTTYSSVTPEWVEKSRLSMNELLRAKKKLEA